MMNETVQHGCAQNAMPDFEVMKKFKEDDSKGRNCKRERIKNVNAGRFWKTSPKSR